MKLSSASVSSNMYVVLLVFVAVTLQFGVSSVSSQQLQQPAEQVVHTFQPQGPQVLLNGGGDGRNLPAPPPGFALVATFAGPFLVPTSNERRPPLSPPSSASVRPSRQQQDLALPPFQNPQSPVAFSNTRPTHTPQRGIFDTASSNRDNFQSSNQNVGFGPGSNDGRPPILELFNPFLSTTQPLFPFHQQSPAPQRQPFGSGAPETFHPRFHTNEHLAAVFQSPPPPSSEPSFNPPGFDQDFRAPNFQLPPTSSVEQQNFELQQPPVVPIVGISRPNGQHVQDGRQQQQFNIEHIALQLNPNLLNTQGSSSAETPTNPVQVQQNLPFQIPANFGLELSTNSEESPTPTRGGSHETSQPHFFTGFSGQNIFENHEQVPVRDPSSSEQPVTFPEHFFPHSETPQAVDLPLNSERLPPQQPASNFPSSAEFPQAGPVTFLGQEPLFGGPQQSSSENSQPQPPNTFSFSGEEVTTSQEQLLLTNPHIDLNKFRETTAALSPPAHHSVSSESDRQTPTIHDTRRPTVIQHPTVHNQQTHSITPPTTFSDVPQRPIEPISTRLPIPTEQLLPLRPLPTSSPSSSTSFHTVGTSLEDHQKQLEILQSPGFVAILGGLQRPSAPRIPAREDQLQRPHSTTIPSMTTTTATTATITTTAATTTIKRKPGRTRVRVLRPASTSRSSRPTKRLSSNTITTERSVQKLPSSDIRDFPPSPPSISTLPSRFSSDKINVGASEPPLVGSDARTCDPSACQLPNCFCGGNKLTPGGLDPSEIPQMVLLTFDDSVNDINYRFYSSLLSNGRKNPNGCPILGTFYVSHEWTDYGKIQTLYAQGHEMASHSITHSDGAPFSQDRWAKEIYGQKRILSALGGVSVGDIRGMRAPFLQGGGNKQFAMLYDTNFTYDSSIPSHVNKPPTWPYTLDYRMPHECGIPPCPNKAYPGVWEVPMVMWEDLKGGHCAMADACQNPTDSRGVYDMLVKNFKRHYTSNRAPFGMFYHYAWFTHDHQRNGFMAFLDAILQLPDVYMVTNSQMIKWMQNPTPISRISDFAPWQCTSNANTATTCPKPKRCSYRFKGDERQFPTCQPCPDKFPWLETYNSLPVIR